jgi:hypothetical protein
MVFPFVYSTLKITFLFGFEAGHNLNCSSRRRRWEKLFEAYYLQRFFCGFGIFFDKVLKWKIISGFYHLAMFATQSESTIHNLQP